MTRRGSLAYYLAAWVCGCFFMSFGLWLYRDWQSKRWGSDMNSSAGLFVFFYFGMISGAFTALVFAFLLRRLADLIARQRPWLWMVFGALLAEGLVWGFAKLGFAHVQSAADS